MEFAGPLAQGVLDTYPVRRSAEMRLSFETERVTGHTSKTSKVPWRGPAPRLEGPRSSSDLPAGFATRL